MVFKDFLAVLGDSTMDKFDISSIDLQKLSSEANLFPYRFGTNDCKIYVKDSNSKTWLENKNIGYWNNNNVIVGKMN